MYNTTRATAARRPIQPTHPMKEGSRLTYRDAGVDIDAGDELVERIKPLVRRAQRPEVLAGIGGFGALVELPQGYKRPVLVSGTDGVGTKLRLAIDSGRHETIGIDLVAMCANDVVVQGAEPLFFLDYYATGKLRVEVAEAVIRGIVEGCVQAGYSLIRKLVALAGANAQTALDGRSLFDRLLAPTRIYVKPLLELIRSIPVRGLAHITGGGLTDNIPRVLPEGLEVVLERNRWHRDPVFDWLQRTGHMEQAEMYRTFNCGIGMVAIVPSEQAQAALGCLNARGETAQVIGEVRRGARGVVIHE